MTTQTQSNGVKQVWNIVKWIVGILLVIVSLATFSKSFLSGLLILTSGLLIVPVISGKLKSKIPFWDKRYVRIITCMTLFIVGISIYGNTPEVIEANKAKEEERKIEEEEKRIEVAKNEKAKEEAEARRNFVRDFVNGDSLVIVKNLNALAKIADAYGYDKAYKGRFETKYLTEMLDSVSGINTILFDPRFDFKEDAPFLKKVENSGVLHNYVIQFNFSSHNEDVSIFSVVYFSDADKGVIYPANSVPDYGRFVNKRKTEEFIEIITTEREAIKHIEETKRRKETFVKKHKSDATVALGDELGRRGLDFKWEGDFYCNPSGDKIIVAKKFKAKNAFGVWMQYQMVGTFTDEGKLLSYEIR